MPPKKPAGGKQAPEKPKSKKAQAHQAAMEAAVADGQKLFKQHDQERIATESADKVDRYHFQLDASIEKQRLQREMALFKEVRLRHLDEEQLAFAEYSKHMAWKMVPYASRLPDIHKESEINTFLTVWKDRQEACAKVAPETAVYTSMIIKNPLMMNPPGTNNNAASNNRSVAFGPKLCIRGEQGIPIAKRRGIINDELNRCLEAFQLTKAIKEDREKLKMVTRNTSYDHKSSLCKVYSQIMSSLDYITVGTLMYYDAIIDDPEGETLMKMKPEQDPVIKYGLWVKVKEMTRSFTCLTFPDLEIRLDPKSSSFPKLPKALGLSKENVAVRVIQLAFDPYSGYDFSGKEYYALDCTLKVDLLNFTDRPKENGDWLMRSETDESYRLHSESYPPRSIEARTEDPAFRISFDVPHTLVIRQPTLLVGKWVEKNKEWELCTHTIFGATFSGNRAPPNHRLATFTIGELAHFAVLQEKVFDAPYESWKLKPLSYDRVIFVLEGRRRGDASDREFRILIEDATCKLLSPDDPELEQLRTNVYEPATLFRLLSQAGFNFIITDEDSRFLENVTPKKRELELKAYSDMAQFCQYYTIASTRHNRHGEDPEMALFRMTQECRAPEAEVDDYDIPDDNIAWYNVRYRLDECVLSAFSESDKDPDLNALAGNETHFNLYTMLLPLKSKEELDMQYSMTNFLLRRCIYQVLMLCRPLSWG
eukprot:gene4414-3213_t